MIIYLCTRHTVMPKIVERNINITRIWPTVKWRRETFICLSSFFSSRWWFHTKPTSDPAVSANASFAANVLASLKMGQPVLYCSPQMHSDRWCGVYLRRGFCLFLQRAGKCITAKQYFSPFFVTKPFSFQDSVAFKCISLYQSSERQKKKGRMNLHWPKKPKRTN